MATFLVRVWVSDRPGALGEVASRIGSVKGDLIGIDILERGGGRAIDELVVELPDAALAPLLVSEVGSLDGVDVEDLRPLEAGPVDQRLDALETAAALVREASVPALLESLVRSSVEGFVADWVAVLDGASVLDGAAGLAASVGPVPPGAWLEAFVAGSRQAASHVGPEDVAWADMAGSSMVVVLGRQGRPWRERERRQLTALAGIVDHRLTELRTGSRGR
ncbi:MAG: hypothetical protein ACR2KC_01840 [Acidimicrobiales bacterium]